ncbi:MAG: AbrB/MazE/SpoVT family DNA-binding domain-containing protein [Rhodoferax sp.]|jgi:AbrB family looped-hinge helix DNA binding protein
MGHALTVKGQVTIPKAMREHMGVAQGQEIEFVAQPGGQVLMFPAKVTLSKENPFLQWIGTGVSGMTTEEILNETRGEGWNQ